MTQNQNRPGTNQLDALFQPPGANDGTITVAAGMSGKLKPFTLPANSTLRDVLNKAELNAEGQQILVDGETVTNLNQRLVDGQTIMLAKPIQGNGPMFPDDEPRFQGRRHVATDADFAPAAETGTITVAAGMSGKLKPFTLPANSTLRDVLNKAELNAEGQQILVDGETVTNLNQRLVDGQTIMLAKPIQGNMPR